MLLFMILLSITAMLGGSKPRRHDYELPFGQQPVLYGSHQKKPKPITKYFLLK